MTNMRLYEDADYDMLSAWWTSWGWPPVIKDWLPPLGAVCSNSDGNDMYAGFLVETNISAAIIEWVVSNKEVKKERKECKIALLDFLCHAAQRKGYKSIFILTPSKSLLKTCGELDFVNTGDLTSMARFF